MSENQPTPRTDAEESRIADKWLLGHRDALHTVWFERYQELRKFARQLERELVEKTELNAFITKGAFESAQVMAKENMGLRQRCEEAKRVVLQRLTFYKTEGCPHPDCLVCQHSNTAKLAAENFLNPTREKKGDA